MIIYTATQTSLYKVVLCHELMAHLPYTTADISQFAVFVLLSSAAPIILPLLGEYKVQ
jgi:hypothetical protein